jgi:hypothetical protein
LDLYGKDVNQNPSSKAQTKRKRIFSQTPLPLDNLKLADLKIQMQGRQIFTPLLDIRDLNFEILLEDGHFEIKPFQFITKGGSVKGSFDIFSQQNAPFIEMRLDIDHLELAPTLETFAADPIIEGELGAKIELSGHGRSIAEIMAGLDGQITTVMSGGHMQNKYVGYGLLDANLRSTMIDIMNPFSQNEKFTEFNCIVNHLDIENGRAAWNGFIDTNQASIFSQGKVNLESERLKGDVKPYPKNGYGLKKVGKISFSFSELAKPLNLGGTLANPSIVIDTTETAITVGKAAGGFVLFGPFGIAAAFASVTPAEDSPCFVALQAAEKGDLEAIDGNHEMDKSFLEKTVDGTQKAFKYIVDTIKKPFGK